MHQNLLNAEFASGEYRNAGDKNLQGSWKRSQRCPGKCREAFAAHMPAVNCTFGIIRIRNLLPDSIM